LYNYNKENTLYGGELFLASTIADAQGQIFLEFFQKDRNGNPKGIIEIAL
jgi:hypothetical protein